MNNQLQELARQTIKDGLAKLPEDWQRNFKKMYAGTGWNAAVDINMVVDEMEEDKLDWAMQQVERSIEKVKSKGI